jgi:glutaredoxin 3
MTVTNFTERKGVGHSRRDNLKVETQHFSQQHTDEAVVVVDAAIGGRLFPLRMELKLYSREWCSWCIDAKDYLTQRGYCFTEVDVGEDQQAYQEMKELSDQTYVPTFVAGDKVLANFDTDQLERFLREHEINP